MIDDTRQLEHGGQGPTMPRRALRLADNIDGILAHSAARIHAERWVSSLRFLTFDDGVEGDSESNHGTHVALAADIDGNNSSNPDIHGQCQPCAKREPLPSGHICSDHMIRETQEREAELLKYTNPCVHVRENSCHACQHIPLFPNEGKVTRFRIRRVYPFKPQYDARRDCSHFVAVSYCWSSENDSKSEPYKVVEEDGSVRSVRAQNSTIDRIVAFARENGFRMIWIDQECIEQNNEKEKEIAIQSMDLVYLRAQTSIGLFQARLSQKHLEYLSMAYESRTGPRPRSRRGRTVFTGCRQVQHDIMCETVSIVVNDKWNTRAWILQEAFASSGNMILLFPKDNKVDVRGWVLPCHEASRSELAIRLDTLQHCIHICARHVRPLLIAATHREEESMARRRRRRAQKTTKVVHPDEMRSTLQRIQLFHPSRPKTGTTVWFANSRQKRVCSAAAAIAYLRVRDLERVADKLAIVANLCGYERRLNTVELDKTQPSLALCTLVLALVNGDFSLLVPQIYQSPESKTLDFPPAAAQSSDFSWVRSFTQDLQDVQAADWDPHGHMSGDSTAAAVWLSPSGISLPCNRWKVDQFVELKQLQTRYAASWLRMRNAKGPSQPSQRSIELATTHILFELMETLKSQGDTHLANSILNSTSNWRWRNRGELMLHVVESVDEFPSGMRIENRRGLFDLDPSPDGWFHQCWIIDRVMENGGFWAARLQDPDSQEPDEKGGCSRGGFELLADENEALGSSEQEQTNISEAGPSNEGTSFPRFMHNGHSSLMLRSTLLRMAEVQVRNGGEGEAAGVYTITAPQPLLPFILTKANGRDREHMSDLLQRRAIFDVGESPQGTVEVLTPFQPVFESIPRPAMRSLSVSWIVERVGDAADDSGKEDGGRFRVTGMTKGMWEFCSTPGKRYRVL